MPPPDMPFKVTIAGYVVADGEVEDLVVGNTITHGFRVFAAESTNPPLYGTAVWARLDLAASFEDVIVDIDGLQFLWQNRSTVTTVVVGDRLGLDGRVGGIGPYEYDAFAIPDIRRRWFIASVDHDARTDNWLLEVGLAE